MVGIERHSIYPALKLYATSKFDVFYLQWIHLYRDGERAARAAGGVHLLPGKSVDYVLSLRSMKNRLVLDKKEFRVAPDTDLAGYPLLPVIRCPAGYPAK